MLIVSLQSETSDMRVEGQFPRFAVCSGPGCK